MQKPTKLLSLGMSYILLFLYLSFSSCQSDSDVFDEVIASGIATNDQDFNAGIENTLQNAGNVGISQETAKRVFYVATNGKASNDGLSQEKPLDIHTAFDVDRIRPGDLYWVKAGDYGKVNIALNQARKTAGTKEHPIGWIGYKDTPGDIEAVEGPTVSWDDYLANGHDLDPSVMPTFSGDTNEAPNFLKNGIAMDIDHWKEFLVVKNFQMRHYQNGIWMERAKHNVFNNIIMANNGYFADIPGQGGSNQDLRGEGIKFVRFSSFNVVKNSSTFNMAKTGFTFGHATESNIIEWSNSDTDNPTGKNPQDYFFHTVGKYNVFRNIKARKLTESNHSGHGLCFNWGKDYGAKYNYAENIEIVNTALHFDGEETQNNTVKNIKIYEDRDHYIYGCAVVVMDGAHDNTVEDLHLRDGSIVFVDSGAHVANGNAGHDNTFKNALVENNTVGISFGAWSTEYPAFDNQFVDCTFKNLDNLFEVERENYGNLLVGCSIESVPRLWFEESKRRDFVLAATTQFVDCNFWKSELPEPDGFKTSNVTQKAP